MESDRTFAEAQMLSAQLLYGRITRRTFLRRAVAIGLSVPTIAMILDACGGGAAAPTATSSAPQPTATIVPTARPVNAGQPTAAAASAASVAATAPTTAGSSAAAGSPTTAAAAASPASGTPVVGGKLTVGDAAEPTGLDPGGLSGVDAYTLEMHMFDQLLAMDTSFKIYPWLATSWKLAEDQKSYVFTLRKDVKFHDGTPFNAAAVKFSFDRIIDPAVKSSSAIAILGTQYDGTDVIDDYTVMVKFKQPFAPFLGGVTTAFMGIVSPTAVKKSGADFPFNPVGTGPFMFKEWVQKQQCTMIRNPDYKWAPDIFKNKGPAYLDQIVWRFVPESAPRQALLDTGEAQIITAVPTQNVAKIKTNAAQQMLIAPRTGGPKWIDFNTAKPPFDQLEVRQALSYGFNRAELVKTLFQDVFPAGSAPLSPPTFGYDKTVEGQYPYDPVKAGQLLDTAGWKMGSSGVREKGGQQFKIACLIGTTEEDSAIAQLLQAQWKPLGVQVDVSVIAGTALKAAELQGQHNIDFKIAVYQDPDILGIYLHSRSIGGFNFTFYKDPTFDSLLDQGTAALDPDKRKQIYSQVQHFIMDKALILPIYYLNNVWAASAKLQGHFSDTAGYYWLYDAYLKS
jgi:peptide/nickel transport system substrate-binding protein